MPIVCRTDPSDKNAGVDIHSLLLDDIEDKDKIEERAALYQSAAFESFVIPPPENEK